MSDIIKGFFKKYGATATDKQGWPDLSAEVLARMDAEALRGWLDTCAKMADPKLPARQREWATAAAERIRKELTKRGQQRFEDLTATCDKVLTDNLPQEVKDAIDRGLAGGMSRKDLLQRCRQIAIAKGHAPRSLTILAIEAYLGADQHGNLRE